jgi:DNA-binding CsgD family transcriptional regulator
LFTTIAQIYDGVYNFPLSNFQEFVLQQVRTIIQFDSAVWLNGVSETNQMHSCVLIDQRPDLIEDYIAGYSGFDLDLVRHHAVRTPGTAFRIEDTIAIETYRANPAYQEFWRPAGIEHAMAIALIDPISRLMELLALWRADQDCPFSDDDSRNMEVLAPLIAVAWRQRQLAHLYESAMAGTVEGSARVRGHAVCDMIGVIYASDSKFNAMMQANFAGWEGPGLPEPVLHFVRSGLRTGHLEGLDLVFSEGDPRSLLAVSPATEIELLSAAETRVATLFAEGKSNALIADELGVSQSTVRNQIASVYRKLGIHSKVDLVPLLRAYRSA